MHINSKVVNSYIAGYYIDDFSRSGLDHFIDHDFDDFDPNFFRDLGRPINPRRKPWSDGWFV